MVNQHPAHLRLGGIQNLCLELAEFSSGETESNSVHILSGFEPLV